MKTSTTFWLLLAWLICGSAAQAQTGTCEPGQAEAFLDVNNVRAKIGNTGLFPVRRNDVEYYVPANTFVSSVFSAGLGIGGFVDDELRMAFSRYGPPEFWPGPLDEQGNPPADCADYDRIYVINQRDIDIFEAIGEASDDMREWPWQLGAPVTDGDGNPDNYNLDGGDQPTLMGHQTLWWIMNDRGNSHAFTQTEPLGIEVKVTAFAASDTNNAIHNSTLFKYNIRYQGDTPLTDVYIGVFMDVDLGNFDDDYVGSDSTIGLGYIYNGDNHDEGVNGYGIAPPAIGIKVLKGPLAENDNLDNDSDGIVDETGERFSMTSLAFFNGSGITTSFPSTAEDYYNLFKGQFRDDWPMTVGGIGYYYSDIPTRFIFPGDPVTGEGWSERNPDPFEGTLGPNLASDRRMNLGIGPVTFQPGDEEEIVVAVIWARGKDHLDSVTKLKATAQSIQNVYDAGFNIAAPTTTPLPQFQLLSPADRAPEQPLESRLRWDAPYTGKTFEVEYAQTSQFADAIVERVHFNNQLLLKGLNPFSTYYWRVREVSAFEAGPWSDTRSFSTSDKSIDLRENRIQGFMTVQNAAGIIDPPDMAAFAINNSGFPILEGNLTPAGVYPNPLQPTPGIQQSTNNAVWGIHTGGDDRVKYDDDDGQSFLERSLRRGVDHLSLYDFEWRFTQVCADGINGIIEPTDCLAFRAFSDGAFIEVPFSLWRVALKDPGPTGDLRLVPVLCEEVCGAGTTDGVFDIGQDHAISDGDNDPYTDWVYWFEPDIETPGEEGYQDFFFNEGDVGREYMARTVLVSLDGGTAPPYAHALPEPGTIFRIVTAPYPIPSHASPNSGSTIDTSQMLYWHAIPADETRLQIDTSPAFSDPVFDSIVAGDYYPLDGLEPGQTYYWRTHSAYLGQQLSPWTDPWSFTIAQNVHTEAGHLPIDYTLEAGYPNPFSTQTSIRYALPEPGTVKLEVFDTLGRRVRVLVDNQQTAGWHDAVLDSKSLPSGLYFYRLTTNNFTDTKSVILMR